MSSEKKAPANRTIKLTLSLSGCDRRINIGKDVVRVLGVPQYVCIKVNEDLSSIAVLPCEEKEYMSVKVPEKLLTDRKTKLRITSKSYVHQLLTTNGLNPAGTYTFLGNLSGNSNAVVFHLTPDAEGADHSEEQ